MKASEFQERIALIVSENGDLPIMINVAADKQTGVIYLAEVKSVRLETFVGVKFILIEAIDSKIKEQKQRLWETL